MGKSTETEVHSLSDGLDATDEWCLRKRIDKRFEVGLYLSARGTWRWRLLPGASRWPEARKRAPAVASDMLLEAAREANDLASAQRRRAAALTDYAEAVRADRG
jgi:hypothetical protein